MMTFKFTGARGQMEETEPLTSGMVGKTVGFAFDDSWADLNKVAVFTAGDVTRHVTITGSTLDIPADVLARPWQRLLVGVLGNDGDGLLVLPSEMVSGPLITQGADPSADPLFG